MFGRHESGFLQRISGTSECWMKEIHAVTPFMETQNETESKTSNTEGQGSWKGSCVEMLFGEMVPDGC